MGKSFTATFVAMALCLASQAQDTEIQYLSGKGLGNTTTWDFYCSDGRNSGQWSKIEVPSQWELQGFGDFTYGRWYITKGRQPSMETAIYRKKFTVPNDWQNKKIDIVFDGVMTDAEVLVNGQKAGETHQGGFYRFSHDIGKLLKFGAENELEVRVAKHSANKSVNAAERRADWWLFGGIYRPVWLEARPQSSIEHVAVDARQNGDVAADVILEGTAKGMTIEAALAPLAGNGKFASQKIKIEPRDGKQRINMHFDGVKTWDCESPNLYTLTLSLRDKGGSTLHTWSQRIGFRTVELRPKDGLYVNGTKVVLKGVNRHTFHPDGGRTTNRDISLGDAKLLKEMNINAVRSHYPPDSHFLDMCDSLGIFYIDELAGWQNCYDDNVGPKLLEEMIRRDVNHPSIIIWSNGNEGGWNYNLDAKFAEHDPQKRHVIHPWADFNDLDTHHYPAFLTGVARFTNGHKVFMPTEFMHACYDQGGGAGLEDFWANYTSHPLFAGGFIWAFSDEAVKRADKGGILDSEGFNAPDGIVGPYREREGSVDAIRDIWSPIQFRKTFITPSFKGDFIIENTFLFSNLKDCTMKYKVLQLPSPLSGKEKTVVAEGNITVPDVEPGLTGRLHIDLPKNFFDADVLAIEAFDRTGHSIGNWTWPIRYADEYLQKQMPSASKARSRATFTETDGTATLSANGVEVTFNKADGIITGITANGDSLPFGNGPVAVGMKTKYAGSSVRADGPDAVFTAKYLGGIDSIVWRMTPDGLLKMDAVMLNRANGGQGFDDAFTDNEIRNLGITFTYPEEGVTGMTWLGRGPYRVWKNRVRGTNYDIWSKAYNNTVTGETHDGKLEYPEFKGYHANIYWAEIEGQNPFTVYSATDGLFLRLFTPQEPDGRQNGRATMPAFPEGDISFLLDIPAIWSFKPVSQHGPKSQPGSIRIKKGDEGIRMNLVFDFRK